MDVSQSKFRPLAFLAAVAVTAVLISAVVAVDADAARGARGGGGGKGGKGGGTTATLTVSPNPVPLGTNITISGSGFGAYQEVLIDTSHFPNPQVTTDASGNFSFVYDYQYGPGSAGVAAYIFDGRDWVMVTWASFTICSTSTC